MTVFQVIPQITISDSQPTILLPLGFVVLVSMVKDIIEDYKRHTSDNAENQRKVLCIPQADQLNYARGNGIFKHITWSKVKVGQIVKVV